MIAIIGTWKMSSEGVFEAHRMLKDGACAGDAVIHAVTRVEDEPGFCSVGYGGLPDRDGHVMTDAVFMDGATLRMGAIASAENIKNPILAARLLCGRETNCLLAGRGAELYAIRHGLAMRDMRTEECMRRWRQATQQRPERLTAYTGHDTVCVLGLDEAGHLAAGVSTSGLFMKDPGRVGDSPIIGSGFYADDRYGAAAATGLGEDAGNISLIALAPDGSYGAATTLSCFPFAAAKGDGHDLFATDSSGSVKAVTEEEIEGVD